MPTKHYPTPSSKGQWFVSLNEMLQWRDWLVEHIPETVLEDRVREILTRITLSHIYPYFQGGKDIHIHKPDVPAIPLVRVMTPLSFFIWQHFTPPGVSQQMFRHNTLNIHRHLTTWYGPDWHDVLLDVLGAEDE